MVCVCAQAAYEAVRSWTPPLPLSVDQMHTHTRIGKYNAAANFFYKNQKNKNKILYKIKELKI